MLSKRILTLVFVVAFLTLLVGCLAPTPPIEENQAPSITSDPVTTAKVGIAYTYDVDATDPDGDTLTYSLTTPTGMVIDSATGVINWLPSSAQVGDNAVTVEVSDGALSDTQSFIIKVSKPTPTPVPPPVNHAPIITTSPITKAVMGVAYLYDVNATDPDGDALTYYLTTNPSGMGINSANGVIDWIPTAEGVFAVEVKVSDGALSDTQNFTITVQTVAITKIVVLPEEMTLVTMQGSETIQSVTAHYDIKSDFEVPIPLGDCTYVPDHPIASVSNDGVITAGLPGTAFITVSYAGMEDTIEVTVVLPVHNVTKDEYYNTIQAAIDDANPNPGDTIEVAPGTYYEHLLIDKALTVKSISGAAGTIIDSNGYRYKVTIEHSDVTFEGFTVTDPTYAGGADATGILVHAYYDEDVSNVQILDNIITQIRSETGTPSTFGSCGINVGYAITKGNTLSDIVISGNTITDIKNPEGGASDHTCGINVWDGADNVLISNNDISDIKFIGILLEYASNVQVEENSITGGNQGIKVLRNQGLEVLNNVLTGTAEWAIVLYGYYGPVSKVTVSGNTIDNCGSGIMAYGGNYYINDSTISDNTITNSTMDNPDNGAIAFWKNISDTTISGNEISSNENLNGVRFGFGGGTLTGIAFENNIISNNLGGVLIVNGTIFTNLVINFNNIEGNTTGVLNESALLVDATYNWWGSEFGPKHDGFPLNGGDTVSDNVDYSNWSLIQY